MSQQELLARVVRILEAVSAPYMLTGSLASSLQGEPRSTHDIDLVVQIAPPAAEALLDAFRPPDYYLDRESVMRAIASRDMFNLLEVDTGDKVDFWMLTDDAFDQARFARRYPQPVGDISVMVSRPEDTILMKLRWAEMSGGSPKQLHDALRVYELQYGQLDLDYLRRWALAIGIQGLLRQIEDEAELL